MPRLQTDEFALSVDATVLHGAFFSYMGVMCKPLFSEHCTQGRKEAPGQTRVQEALDPDGSGIRAVKLRKLDGEIAKGGGSVVQ